MNHMNMYLQELLTAGGGTVKIIAGFGECAIDPEATKAVVTELLVKMPEYAKAQNHHAKISALRQTAGEEYNLAEKAKNAGDKTNEALHTSAYQSAINAITVLHNELQPLADDCNAAFTRLYMENRQPLPCGPGQYCCEDGQYETLQAKFDALKEHERLTETGDVIPDWSGTEYWQKINGKWTKGKINFVNELPPAQSVLQDRLTAEQQKEISDQQEAERIAAMPPDERANAEQAELGMVADEANRLAQRAEIQEKEFDKKAWYKERCKEVEAKYA